MSASGQNTGSARNEVERDQVGQPNHAAAIAKTGTQDTKADFAGLIEKIAESQDRDAFAALFAHFAPRLKGYLLRLGASDGQAEEVLQEALLTVWRKAHLFDRKKAAASTWIFTIARYDRTNTVLFASLQQCGISEIIYRTVKYLYCTTSLQKATLLLTNYLPRILKL